MSFSSKFLLHKRKQCRLASQGLDSHRLYTRKRHSSPILISHKDLTLLVPTDKVLAVPDGYPPIGTITAKEVRAWIPR